jgi:hypothetical protein
VTFVWILLILTLGSALMMGAFRAKGRSVAVNRAQERARLVDREFSGVVTDQSRMAHAFDAGYSCVITIRCDDGSTVRIDAGLVYMNKYPVGFRVVKRAGQHMPTLENAPGAAPRSDAPAEDSEG